MTRPSQFVGQQGKEKFYPTMALRSYYELATFRTPLSEARPQLHYSVSLATSTQAALAALAAPAAPAANMALLSSTVVFKSRAAELGLSQAAIDKAVEEGLGTMGQFGFSTKFLPGIPIDMLQQGF
jgi:hypothetical protein